MAFVADGLCGSGQAGVKVAARSRRGSAGGRAGGAPAPCSFLCVEVKWRGQARPGKVCLGMRSFFPAGRAPREPLRAEYNFALRCAPLFESRAMASSAENSWGVVSVVSALGELTSCRRC